MTISERIFELLEQRGMSCKEFSGITGITQSSIKQLEEEEGVVSSILIILFSNIHVIAILVEEQLSCTSYGGMIMKRI